MNTTKELIEKQIERVADQLDDAKRWIAAGNDPAAPLFTAIYFLLQAIQCQQLQIEELRGSLTETDEIVKGLVVAPDTMRALFKEVRKNVGSKSY